MHSDKLPLGERMSLINTAAVIKPQPANCQGCQHDAAGLYYNTAITAEQKAAIKGLIKGYFNE